MFERDKVIPKRPERAVTLSEGDGAGAFASRRNADGNPRLVAGFSVVSFEESNGSVGVFRGHPVGQPAGPARALERR